MKFKTGLFKAKVEDIEIYHNNHPIQFYLSFIWIIGWIFVATYSMFNFESLTIFFVSIISFGALKGYDSWVLHTNRMDKLEKSGLFK